MIQLQLERPIVFFDLETTTADSNTARIVEISLVKLYPNGNKDVKTRLVNPGVDIPDESSKIHGIFNDDVKDKLTFKQIAKAILKFIQGCDLGGYNSNKFDIPVLFNEFLRAGITWDYSKHQLIDVFNIFRQKEKRDLSAASIFYLGKSLVGAHSAEADIIATVDILGAQLERYPDLPRTVGELSNYTAYGKELIDRDKDGDIIFSFGNKKGLKCKHQKEYLQWMVGHDFSEDVKMVARKLLVDNKI